MPQHIRVSPNGKLFYVVDMDADGAHMLDGQAFKEGALSRVVWPPTVCIPARTPNLCMWLIAVRTRSTASAAVTWAMSATMANGYGCPVAIHWATPAISGKRDVWMQGVMWCSAAALQWAFTMRRICATCSAIGCGTGSASFSTAWM